MFTEMFIAVFSTFHMTFVQISDFDWLPGLQKSKCLKEKKRKEKENASRFSKVILWNANMFMALNST